MVRKSDSGLYVTRLDFVENLIWLVDQPMDADTDYESVDCREFGTIWMEFIISPTSDPIGSLFIEQSMDNSVFFAFAFDVGKYSVIDASGDLTVTEGEGEIAVDDPATETRFLLGVEKPPPFLRGRWASGSGGSATGMDAKNFGRS